MPIIAQLSRLVVYGLPLAFVVIAWLAPGGLPEALDSDESFLTYLQSSDSGMAEARAAATLQGRVMDRQRTATATFRTQQPSPARVLHYLLLGAGVRDTGVQALIISLLGTVLTVALLWRLFGQPALFVVALAVVLDHVGFLTWTVNASRIWMFVLFFALILAVKSGRPLGFAVLAFCVAQLDFRTAAFTGATALAFAVLTHHWRAWSFVLAAASGPLVSIAIYGAEVFAFFGWEGLLHEVMVIRAWISTMGSDFDVVTYVDQASHGPFLVLNHVARESHNVPVLLMVIGGIVWSVFALAREWISEPHRFLAKLTLSAAGGTIVTSFVLAGFFVESFVTSALPLACFLIAPALGMVALEVRAFLEQQWYRPHLGTAVAALVLAPLVFASVVSYQPATDIGLLRALQSEIEAHGSSMRNLASLLPWSSTGAMDSQRRDP